MAEILRRKAKLVSAAKTPQVNISPLGGDPLDQVLDEESGSFIPDHTMLPLTLVPSVTIEGEDASAKVTSQGWWRVRDDGNEQQVTSAMASEGLELVVASSGLVRLKIKTNTPANSTPKYIYRCTLNRITVQTETVLHTTVNGRPGPMLDIDAPSASFWNPFDAAKHDVLTVRCAIHAHGHAGLHVDWKKIENGKPRAIDPSIPEDCELEPDGNDMRIDRRWMGEKISLVAELTDGNQIYDRKYLTVKRRIPEYESSMLGSDIFSDEDSTLQRRIQIRQKPGGVIANPSQELLITWYEGSKSVGTGNSHSYDTRGKEEMEVAVGIEDRGPLKLFTVDGKYLTVGAVLVGGR